MPWSQNYDPLHSLGASTLVAAIPVVLLLALLAVWHVRAHLAALAGLGAAIATAVVVFGMPAPVALAAAGTGAAFGLFPIGWIVLNAVFTYRLAVESGTFEEIKKQIARLSDDVRIQSLMIAFCFGAFVEGCAGFGAPVAISGAMLLGLGFKPLDAAKLALIGNTAPVAFGSVGIPITTLARVTDLPVDQLSMMVGRQLPFFSLIVPFWLVAAQSGLRGMRQVWPACLVCGASFGVTQWAVSNFHGPWLVDIVAAVVAMFSLLVLMRFWRPAAIDDGAPAPGIHHPRFTLRPWLPWLMLAVFVALWKVQPVEAWLKAAAPWNWKVPLLHEGVQRMPPVVPKPEFEKGTFDFQILAGTGTALLVAAILSALALGLRPVAIARCYWRTILSVRISLLTIALMLALGFTTRYCGSDTTMGLAFAATGSWFPFFSPLLGWLGVALTGSDTSSNVLFGNLQKVTAEQIGISPILTCAANSSGGVMGKMIDAQSIVVAQTATGAAPGAPGAGTILRAVFWHSLALAVLVGLLVLLQAKVFPEMIPR
ncbi:MAG: lactate permease LctP family transporter [Chthoniobacteraceae bacterium]